MQYVLTEEERAALVPRDELTLASHALAAAREKLLLISGFDCIHNEIGRNYDGYCSGCPCSPIDDGNDYKTWQRVCWLAKEYPQ